MVTDLQKVSRQVNWFISHTLQYCSMYNLRYAGLPISFRTLELLDYRNSINRQLKVAVKKDYQAYKKKVLAERKKLLDSK